MHIQIYIYIYIYTRIYTRCIHISFGHAGSFIQSSIIGWKGRSAIPSHEKIMGIPDTFPCNPSHGNLELEKKHTIFQNFARLDPNFCWSNPQFDMKPRGSQPQFFLL